MSLQAMTATPSRLSMYANPTFRAGPNSPGTSTYLCAHPKAYTPLPSQVMMENVGGAMSGDGWEGPLSIFTSPPHPPVPGLCHLHLLLPLAATTHVPWIPASGWHLHPHAHPHRRAVPCLTS